MSDIDKPLVKPSTDFDSKMKVRIKIIIRRKKKLLVFYLIIPPRFELTKVNLLRSLVEIGMEEITKYSSVF